MYNKTMGKYCGECKEKQDSDEYTHCDVCDEYFCTECFQQHEFECLPEPPKLVRQNAILNDSRWIDLASGNDYYEKEYNEMVKSKHPYL
jgi:hypothetical protein